MASVVDICNLALAHLGDSATVASIDPPEGSAQAEHCARFYPVALQSLLEMHDWAFATRREPLASVANPSTTWLYAYAKPSTSVKTLAILASTATSDISDAMGFTPQDFAEETDNEGNIIILTNQADAVLRHVVYVVDPTKFSPLFTRALGWMLAGELAGPVIKGVAGAQMAETCLKSAMYWFGLASKSDASQGQLKPTHTPSWIAAR